jgi:hypothetical protein
VALNQVTSPASKFTIGFVKIDDRLSGCMVGNPSLTGLRKLFRPRLACIKASGGRVTPSKNYQRKLVEFSLLNFDYWICLLITAIGGVLVIALDRGRRIKWHRLRARL